jgi:CubicO group peptidase (beta-lactamase class C family)
MTAEAFGHIGEEFDRQLAEYPPGTGAAVAVYIDNELVLDLYGGQSAPETRWVSETMAVTFSATKGVSTATVLGLVARERALDLDQPIARYWPAFGAAGKEAITLADVLSHRAGLPYWEGYPAVVTAESSAEVWLQQDEITASIAASPPIPGAPGRFVYHSVTFGWLVHGLVRAVTGVSLGETFADIYGSPHGLEYYIGISPERRQNVATLFADPPLILDPGDPDFELNNKALLPGPTGIDYLHNLPLLNSSAFHAVPQGACNGIGTARGLAGAYMALADLHADELIGRFTEALLAVHGPGARREQGLGFQVRMPTPWNPTNTAFGHTGAGGGVGFYDPERNLAFALVTNHMNFGVDERADRLRWALARDLGVRF